MRYAVWSYYVIFLFHSPNAAWGCLPTVGFLGRSEGRSGRDHIYGVLCTSEAMCSPHQVPVTRPMCSPHQVPVTRPINWATDAINVVPTKTITSRLADHNKHFVMPSQEQLSLSNHHICRLLCKINQPEGQYRAHCECSDSGNTDACPCNPAKTTCSLLLSCCLDNG